eukprot:4664031-Pyramimonas_sp.AAC.1
MLSGPQGPPQHMPVVRWRLPGAMMLSGRRCSLGALVCTPAPPRPPPRPPEGRPLFFWLLSLTSSPKRCLGTELVPSSAAATHITHTHP